MVQRQATGKQSTYKPTDGGSATEAFWRIPTRLVDDGTWAKLWNRRQEDLAVRGGGAATSILPVLATHVWPGKSPRSGTAEAEPGWTVWWHMRRELIGAMADVHPDTVTRGLGYLEELGLAQWAIRRGSARNRHRGGQYGEFRLSTSLWPQGDDDEWAEFPTRLLYHGLWAALPTNAARHLYVVIACLDPIRDPEAYVRGQVAKGEDQLTAHFQLSRTREANAKSHRELCKFSGLSRSVLSPTVRALEKKVFPRGHPRPQFGVIDSAPTIEGVDWYALDRRAWDVDLGFEWLRSPYQELDSQELREELVAFRAAAWPSLVVSR